MRNPLVTEAAHVVRAVAALKLRKSDWWEASSDGVTIHQRGKPVLHLTYAAAREFAHQVEETGL